MGQYLNKLLSLSTPSLGADPAVISDDLVVNAGRFGLELAELLSARNGFYAFESALHVFPTGKTEHISLEQWNNPDLWIGHYGDLVKDIFFFAEDIFGHQFCFYQDKICLFDAETAKLESFASNLEEWAQVLLDNYPVWTGHPLANQWQEKNGSLPFGFRLMPMTPFTCGGEFVVENLYPIKAVSGMRTRANLATQIANMTDDSTITFDIVE